jgi:hypothetical protein
LKYFSGPLLSALNKTQGTDLTNFATETIKEHVDAGDKRFYTLADYAVRVYKGFWKDSLKESVDKFQEVQPTPAPADLPFES